VARARKLPKTELLERLNPRCVAIKKLLLRGWAGRCWIAQEFVLNEELGLMCGGREIKEWFVLLGIVPLVLSRILLSYLQPRF
jgi:hypothetical protein